jgi:Ca2+-binding EF-hand superfamily protein
VAGNLPFFTKKPITSVNGINFLNDSSGIIAIGRKFRIMDDDRTGALSLAEFKKAMAELNLDLQGRDIQNLFEYFDRDGNNEIAYNEFLRGVVGSMSEARALWVKKAFSILDEDASGVVNVEDIRKRYGVSQTKDSNDTHNAHISLP